VDSDDVIRQIREVSRAGKARRERRVSRAFYSQLGLGEGLGFYRREAMDGRQRRHAQGGVRSEEEEESDMQAPHVSERRERQRIPSGFRLLARGWLFGLGRMVAPAAFFYLFIFSNFFSISVFTFLLYLFQNRFKSIQTKANNFIKFKTIF
jgi:hypothetical protein